jgi:hypothetical protein
MPRFFENWLRSLSKDQAEEMVDYFDGSWTVDADVSHILNLTHPLSPTPLQGIAIKGKGEVCL